MNSVWPSRSSGGADLAVEGEGSAELEIDVAGLRRAAVEVRSVRSMSWSTCSQTAGDPAAGRGAGRPELRGGPPGRSHGPDLRPPGTGRGVSGRRGQHAQTRRPPVPSAICDRVARHKLHALGVVFGALIGAQGQTWRAGAPVLKPHPVQQPNANYPYAVTGAFTTTDQGPKHALMSQPMSWRSSSANRACSVAYVDRPATFCSS